MDPLRLSGLATNLDTEAIISKLMTLEQQPLNQVNQQATTLGKQKAAWTDIGQAMSALKDAADNLSYASAWTAVSAAVTDSSALSVSVTGKPSPDSYLMKVSSLAQAEAVQSGTFAGESTALGLRGTVSFGDKSVTFDATDSLDTIRDKINAAGAGLSASVLQVSPGQYSLLLRSTQTGTAGAVAFTDDATDRPLRALGLLDGGGAKHVVQVAQDAQFSIGGVSFTRGSNTVSDALPGLTLTLKATNTTGFSLNVSTDTAGLAAKINDFVAKYNALIDKIKASTNKDGVLEADPTLLSLQGRMANLVMDSIPGLPASLSNLSSVGVTLNRDGHLNVDSNKLTQALAANPSGVGALFTTAGSGLGPAFSRMLASFTQAGGTVDTMGKTFDQRARQLQTYRDTLSQILKVREDTLRQQFKAMEQAVSTLRSQGNWLMAQLGGASAGNGASG